MHGHGTFAGKDSVNADCHVTGQLCRIVLNLPVYSYLTKEMVGKVADALK